MTKMNYNVFMDTKQQIKHLLLLNNITMTELCQKMSERISMPYSIHNISGKLKRDTIKYSEMKTILDILGYEFVIRKKTHSSSNLD